jgi:tetratricopeptide (TPR) repeat protein
MMAVRPITVFLSCSSDVLEEKAAAREVIGRLNALPHISAHCLLVPLAYEYAVPAAVGEGPQGVVDNYLGTPAESDVFVCFRWHRAGTPLRDASGVELPGGVDYEFQSAYNARVREGKPHILLYRCFKAIPPDANFQEAAHVKDFFDRFRGKDADFLGLPKKYTSTDDFKLQLTQDLQRILDSHFLPRQQTLLAQTITPYRQEIAEVIDFYASPFVGRESETASLTEFAKRRAPGYRFIEAIGGYGKTAFVAHLVRLHESGEWENPPDLLYFFVRKYGQANTADALLRALNGQLLGALGIHGTLPAQFSELKAQFGELWSKASLEAGAARPLLLIVDSVDEMAAESPSIVQLLPANLAPYVHVLVSSRPEFEVSRHLSLEHPLRRAERISLGRLEKPDLSALLQHQGVATEEATRLAGQIANKTGGHPLYARFVCQDVAQKGESMLDQLPEDVAGYFQEQVRSLKGLADADILYLLTVALGAMTQDEIRLALGLDDGQTTRRIAAVRRFLLGKERLELMHLEVRTALRTDLDRDTLLLHERNLVAWCKSYETMGWPDTTPGYVVLHYAEHLRNAGDRTSLYGLITKEWMRRHFRVTGSYQTFAGDLEIVMKTASAHPQNLVALARGSLVRGTLTSLATGVVPEVLGLMAALGRSIEARGYAALKEDAASQSEAYRWIGEALLARNMPGAAGEARAALQHALVIAAALEDRHRRTEVLGSLGPPLFRLGEFGQFVKLAAELDDLSRQQLIESLARAFVSRRERAAFDALLPLAESIGEPWTKTRTVTELAAELAPLGDRRAVDRALQGLEAEGYASRLTGLFEHLVRAGDGEQAVAAVEKMNADQFQASYLADIVRTAAARGDMELLDRALRATSTIRHSWTKADAVGAVACAFAQVGQADRCLELARAALVVDRQPEWAAHEQRLEVLEAQAAVLRAAAGDRVAAEKTLAPIHDESTREWALREIASVGSAEDAASAHGSPPPLELATEFVEEARRKGDGHGQANALLDVARNHLIAGNHAAAVDAITNALALAWEWYARMLNGREQYALSRIAEAFARGGDSATAFTVCARIRGDSAVDSARAAVARALADAGDYEAAWDAVRQIAATESRDQALAAIAVLAGRKGQMARARQTVLRITYSPRRDATRAEIAEQLAGAGDHENALTFGRAIDDVSSKAKILGYVGLTLVQAGRAAPAVDLCDEALAIVSLVADDDAKVAALCAIDKVIGHSETRRAIDRAVDGARAIGPLKSKARAYGHIARRLVESGEPVRALEFIDAALEFVSGMGGDEPPVPILAAFVPVLVEAQEKERVIGLVNRIAAALRSSDVTPSAYNARWDLFWRARSATALARVGQSAEAVSTAREVLAQAGLMRPEPRPAGGRPLGEFFEKLQSEWEARRQLSRVRSMLGAADAVAAAGDRSHALDIAREALGVAEAIADPVHRVAAFIDTGRNLLDLGDQGEAITVLTRAHDGLRLGVDERRTSELEIALAAALLRCGREQKAAAAWTRALSTAHGHGRVRVLEALEAGAPILAALEGTVSVWKLYELIVETDDWWSSAPESVVR